MEIGKLLDDYRDAVLDRAMRSLQTDMDFIAAELAARAAIEAWGEKAIKDRDEWKIGAEKVAAFHSRQVEEYQQQLATTQAALAEAENAICKNGVVLIDKYTLRCAFCGAITNQAVQVEREKRELPHRADCIWTRCQSDKVTG